MGFAGVNQDPLRRPLPGFKGPQFSHSMSASFGFVILHCLKAPVTLLVPIPFQASYLSLPALSFTGLLQPPTLVPLVERTEHCDSQTSGKENSCRPY